MARNFRKQPGGSGLFAFQDIITAVIGIFLLMILLLIISMNNIIPAFGSSAGGIPGFLSDASEEPPLELQEHLDNLIQTVASLNEENRQLQYALAQAEAAGDVILLEGAISDLQQRLAQAKAEAARLGEDLEQAIRQARLRAVQLGLVEIQERVEAFRKEITEKQNRLNQLGRQISVLEREIRIAQSRLLEEMQKRDQVWIIPELTHTTKEPVLFVVTGGRVTRHRFNRPNDDMEFNSSRLRQDFRNAVADLRPLDHYLVFFFRPSGISEFESILEMARDSRFEIGYDAIKENLVINFSSPRNKP